MFVINTPITFILAALGGVVYCLGFPLTFAPAFAFGPIIGIAVVLFFFSATDDSSQVDRSPKKALRVEIAAWLGFSMVCNLLGHYWIAATLGEFGDIPAPFNYLLASLFSLVIMPHYLIMILLWRLIPERYNPLLQLRHPGMKSFALAIVLTSLESFTPQQFPAHMGHAWLHLAPYLGLAPIFGVPIYSFVSFWMALGIVMLIKKRFIDYGAIVTFSLVLIISIINPLKQIPANRRPGGPLKIRMMQPNIGNHLKLNLERGHAKAIEHTFQLYQRLSSAPSELGQLDLIIWPETAFPPLVNTQRMREGLEWPHPMLQKIAAQTKADLLFGGYDANPERQAGYHSQYNAAIHLSYRPEIAGNPLKFSQVYHKRILIPFGERLPLGPFGQYLRPYIQNISYFGVGKTYPLFKLKSGHRFTIAICYEVLFYNYIRSYLNSVEQTPDFLVNLTNDSWYGRTSEPYQHLFLSKWRALEFQIPLVRMTNTGISSITYPDGSESERTSLFVATNLDLRLKLGEANSAVPTLFQQWGFLMMLPLWGVIFILLLLGGRFQRRRAA
ncbi:MAG: apolipoprotein N-acyltransferase [Bdellovibrionales bacterium]|jgi:apolipoprotein N-acyltransferase|nr:apolipoprotein N-acyltransferase [Bdellovibrionales bacterium]MBT3525618.1 apolipoprotein N-acyltransferase [Bdellovibrionales bacterium]MBT7668979.1 apolipoprotein N-acyltransferase [Bdellovibrionales bacterium]MBT7766710.1 apolipoprotein N-acyltransferase [Bdellovibrionales bacterium]